MVCLKGSNRILISLREVSKNFGEFPALEDVSVDIYSHRFTGIVGPGASGKTVFLKIIAGLIRPDRGKVFVESADITSVGEVELQKVRSRIGMLFQNNALFDYMTVGENVAFPLRRLFDLPEGEIESRVRERLERVGLAGMEDRLPASLSGGQKKRVGIARSTIAGQPIIIYDDPTAGLDPVTASRIFLLLRQEQEANKTTVLCASSDVDSLLNYVDYLIIFRHGRMVFSGSCDELFTSPTVHPFARAFIKGEWNYEEV